MLEKSCGMYCPSRWIRPGLLTRWLQDETLAQGGIQDWPTQDDDAGSYACQGRKETGAYEGRGEQAFCREEKGGRHRAEVTVPSYNPSSMHALNAAIPLLGWLP